MFYAAWAIALPAGAAYGLSIIGLRALYFERRTRALRAEVGSYFDERIIVENRSWIPKLWLEIEDQGQHPEHTASFVVSLGPYGRFVRPVHTLCRQRGVFQLGPVFVESGDPFGLFRQRRQIDGSKHAGGLSGRPAAGVVRSGGRRAHRRRAPGRARASTPPPTSPASASTSPATRSTAFTGRRRPASAS